MLINMQILLKYNVFLWKAGERQERARNSPSEIRVISHLSLLSASGFEMLLSVILSFCQTSGEENMEKDQMSSSVSITQTPILKRAGGSRKLRSPKGGSYSASESTPGWDGVAQVLFLLGRAGKMPHQALQCLYLDGAWGGGTPPLYSGCL